MTDWTSGYVADIGYTYGYYLELNPQRVKEARAQIVNQLLAGALLHNRRKHVGRAAVVDKGRARGVFNRQRQKAAHPILIAGAHSAVKRIRRVAGGQCQQVADAQLQEIENLRFQITQLSKKSGGVLPPIRQA